MRIDGVLTDETTVPKRMVAGVVSRIKIMSDLDISERRVPQDGRVGLTVEGRHVDVRVVTLPSVHGESVVLRILDKESIRLDLEKLGMQEQELERFRRAFHRAHGAVLVTGPTGSGKSTTLYGALTELNTPEKNIITIEDPVEYQIQGITQVQINPKAGLTFATGLRSMMRADPDILMVGEIRDRETAQIAIEGALTGHMVLSTLHTNDAPSAITRLIEMGIEPFLVASAIDCVVAQRLARTLCTHCKRAHDHPGRRAARPRLRRAVRHRGLRAGRLRPLRRDGLSRPDRPVRGDDDVRRDPLADAAARRRRADRRRRRRARECAGCARTASTRSSLD